MLFNLTKMNIFPFFKLVLLPPLTALLLLPGCSLFNHYEYSPPATHQGKQCVTHCLSDKQRCEFSAQSLYEQCLSGEEQTANQTYLAAMQNYYFTKQHNPNSHISQPSKYDYKAKSCFKNDSKCTRYYNQCYELCGGSVVLVKD